MQSAVTWGGMVCLKPEAAGATPLFPCKAVTVPAAMLHAPLLGHAVTGVALISFLERRSREAVQDWWLYLRLALPSTAMLCVEWWAYEFCILMSGWLPNPKLHVAVMGMCANTQGGCGPAGGLPRPAGPALLLWAHAG
jgi:hypothetical protein